MSNVIYDKSVEFAVDILKLAKELRRLKEYEIANQILRSGTSIGANVAEAKYAQGRKDFNAKMAIARKEANETLYWLTLLAKAEVMPKETLRSFANEATQILKILTSIIKTSNDNL